MVDSRLRQLLETRQTAQGDDLFGEYELISDPQRLNLAPVRRVALLTESFLPKVDGVSKTSYLTVRYLQQTGREVLVFAPDIAVTAVGSSEVVPLPSISVPSATETRMALPLPWIAEKLAAFKPDLIHLASPALMTVVGMAFARDLNIPVIANYQTDLPGYAAHYGLPLLSAPVRSWLRYLHNGCHINLVPSRTIRDELASHGFRRLRIWGRGVNLQRFHPDHQSAEMRQRLLAGRDPDSLLCIYVGRLANEKRIDLLLEAARLPGIALTIIGDGHMREELERLFAGTGTHFTGYLYKHELAAAFASADVFVFPGSNETFGQVVQEAMASGLPAVVTELGSVHDLVLEMQTGMIVHHDAHAFAAALQTLHQDRDLLQQMSFAARTSAEQRPWSVIMSQLEDSYREAVSIAARFKRLFQTTFYHRPLAIGARLQHWGMISQFPH